MNQRKQRLKSQKTEIEVNSEFFTVMRGQRWMLTGYARMRHMEKVSKEQSSNNRIWAPSQRGSLNTLSEFWDFLRLVIWYH